MKRLASLVAAVLALVPVGGPADAQARKEATVLMSEDERGRKFQEDWGFSDAVVTGDTIYLSGIVVGLRPGETDMKPAFDRVYQRIGAILKRAGASWDDVVDMTSFHTDVEGQIEAMVAAQRKYVKAPFPAWTAIGVARILGNGITEIKITARRPKAAAGAR